MGNADDVESWLGWLALTGVGGPMVPFVPTRKEALDMVLKVLDLKEDDVFYDLGCGDGRVVIEILKRFPVKKGVCVEVRRDLLEEAVKRAKAEGVESRFVAIHGDFFEVPLKEATVVYMYLLGSVNDALKPKLSRDLAPGTRVVTLDFQVPGWKPVKTVGNRSGWQSTVYYYVIGESDR
ncbi:MAG: class I SAM-dependent methyltransferase [Acidilobaceae archaeon]|nr:class I SAM-dependent methyltransferase [Acidilobaceae archaeon]